MAFRPIPTIPRYIAVAGQGDLGMPRNYYLLEGEPHEASRRAYRAYVQRIQELAGIPGASANGIIALETSMARQRSRGNIRDVAKTDDLENVAGLEAKAPEFDWALLLGTAGLASARNVVMNENTATSAVGKLLVATPLQSWKDYLAFRFVSDRADEKVALHKSVIVRGGGGAARKVVRDVSAVNAATASLFAEATGDFMEEALRRKPPAGRVQPQRSRVDRPTLPAPPPLSCNAPTLLRWLDAGHNIAVRAAYP